MSNIIAGLPNEKLGMYEIPLLVRVTDSFKESSLFVVSILGEFALSALGELIPFIV